MNTNLSSKIIHLDTKYARIQVRLNADFSRVFEPTFVGRSIAEELLNRDINGKTLLDVGCGSGIIAVASAMCGAHVVGLDVNECAVKTTVNNAKLNSVDVVGIISNGLEKVREEKFDIIVANCPILPSNISPSTNTPVFNGVAGKGLLIELIRSARANLNNGGVFYTWCSELGGFEETEQLMRHHWDAIEVVKTFEACIRAPGGIDTYPKLHESSPDVAKQLRSASGRIFTSAKIYRLCKN